MRGAPMTDNPRKRTLEMRAPIAKAAPETSALGDRLRAAIMALVEARNDGWARVSALADLAPLIAEVDALARESKGVSND